MTLLSKANMELIQFYMNNPYILEMKKYYQHGKITTYDHCINVMKKACELACRLRFNEEQLNNLITGAILHDFYLYDWHTGRKRQNGTHAWSHPKTALSNAEKHFELNDKQKNIIRSHMYPTCFLHPPKCKEAWIVVIIDKYCAIEEYFRSISKKSCPQIVDNFLNN